MRSETRPRLESAFHNCGESQKTLFTRNNVLGILYIYFCSVGGLAFLIGIVNRRTALLLPQVGSEGARGTARHGELMGAFCQHIIALA